jgi:hypothetical protein
VPDSESILRGLTDVADDFAWLAAVWHAALAAAVAALASGRWRPGRRAASRLLVLPVLSVSLLAWLAGTRSTPPRSRCSRSACSGRAGASPVNRRGPVPGGPS